MALRQWMARLTLCCCLAAAPPLPAATSHEAHLQWQTLRSDHFQLHFHQQEEAIAREVLAIAEEVHARLAPLMAWVPAQGTEIVLSDESDIPNGWATPYPSDRMVLYLVPPDGIDGLEDHAGWLELLITHEYLHILHLDKASGTPAALRQLFGRHLLLFPNAMQPAWFTEGLATYVETDRQRGIGRGQSSYYEMLMRLEALGGIKPLRQVNQPLVSWPMGDTPYLYGVYFYQWLAERYGEAKIGALVANYSDNIVPFRIGSNARQVYGKSLDELWQEFGSAMRERFEMQRLGIEARGASKPQRLSGDGYFTGPLVGGEGGDLYYTAFNGRERPALVRLRGEQREWLAELQVGARLSFHPTQGLLVAQPDRCTSAARYYDLYRYDSASGRGERLTKCGRYRDAVWAGDGLSIIAVHHRLGYSELHRLDGSGKMVERLWRGEAREVPADISLSPDGRTLAAALWQPDEGWNLALFDLETKEWRVVARTRAIEGQPRFIDGGKRLLFSADYDGVYNLYVIELATRQIRRLSNVVGGAFYPVLNGDTLNYVGYSAEGFDLYRTDYQPHVETVTPAAGPAATVLPVRSEKTTGDAVDYSPWSSVRPHWWFPHLYLGDSRSEVGLVTAGSDTLQRHLYLADIGYDVENGWMAGSVDYIYDRWDTVLKMHVDARPKSLFDSNGRLLKIRNESSTVVELVTPFYSGYRKWGLHLGAVEESANDGRLIAAASAEPALRDRLAGVALTFDSSSRMPRSVSRSYGREVMVVAEDSDLLRGSDYSGRALLADWREYVRLGGEHVLALRGVAGKGEEGIRRYNLGGIADVNYLPMLLDSSATSAPFNRRSFALRGYDSGLPQLTGNQMRLASLEYRFPLWRLERGWMAPPVGLHQLHGALFAETGSAWQEGVTSRRYYSSYGAELGVDSVLFYELPLRLALGYAHGIDRIGTEHYYLRLGASF